MRKVLLLILIGAALAGCYDDDARRRVTAQKQVDEAITAFDAVNQGYYLPGAPGSELTPESMVDYDVEKFRQEKLANAQEALQVVISKGARDQQINARVWLSDVYASNARYMVRPGADKANELRRRNARLLNLLSDVSRADQKMRELQPSSDGSELRAEVDVFADRVQTLKAQREQYASDAAQAKKIIAAKEKPMTAAFERSKQLHNEAAELRAKAFMLKGKEQSDAEGQAAKLALEGELTARSGETLEVAVNAARDELALAQSRIEATDKLVADMNARIDAAKAVAEERNQLYARAVAAKADAQKELTDEIAAQVKEYNDHVGPVLDAASEPMVKAVSELKTAFEAARGQDAAAIQAQYAYRVIEQVDMLLRHAETIAGIGEKLATIVNTGKLSNEAQSSVAATLDGLRDKQTALINAANEAIAAGELIATELSQTGDTDPASAGGRGARAIEFFETQKRALSEVTLAGS